MGGDEVADRVAAELLLGGAGELPRDRRLGDDGQRFDGLYVASLDERLSRVALEPNAPERAERLWRERVDVMHTLVQVRYADAIGTY